MLLLIQPKPAFAIALGIINLLMSIYELISCVPKLNRKSRHLVAKPASKCVSSSITFHLHNIWKFQFTYYSFDFQYGDISLMLEVAY